MESYNPKESIKEYLFDKEYDIDNAGPIKGSVFATMLEGVCGEVAPYKVGMCLIKPTMMNRSYHYGSSTEVLLKVITLKSFYRDKDTDTLNKYSNMFDRNQLKVRLDKSGNIWLAKGKDLEYDTIPADTVEEIVKSIYPQLFHVFVFNRAPKMKEALYGLFLYDEKNAKAVNDLDKLFRNDIGMIALEPNEIEYFENCERLQIIDSYMLGHLAENNELI